MLRLKTVAALGTAVAAATAGLAAVVPAAHAATTATQTVSVVLGDLDQPGSGTFAQFDPALGTLTSVTITADVTMTFQSCLTNLSTESSSLPAGTITGEAPITFQGGIVADATGSLAVPATTLAANIGGADPANRVDSCENWLQAGAASTGPAPTPPDTSYLTGTSLPTFSRTVTDPAILAQYTGTGTVPVSWTATSNSTLGQPSEWRIIFLAKGSGTARIQYDYTPASPVVTPPGPDDTTTPVGPSGELQPVPVATTLTVTGLTGTQNAVGVLYGPFADLAHAICTAPMQVGSVTFPLHNGQVKTPTVTATKPGYYTWVVTSNGTGLTTCGEPSASVLVHRPRVRPVTIATGYDGVRPLGATDRAKPLVVSIPAAGVHAPVVTVGSSHRAMNVPGNVHEVGWLKDSARVNDLIGTTIAAGHVSDDHDNPGALAHLKRAKVGDLVTMGGVRFKVSRIFTQPRTKRLPPSLFTTVGKHRLALVTCTHEILLGGGHFHYTQNLVVIADQV